MCNKWLNQRLLSQYLWVPNVGWPSAWFSAAGGLRRFHLSLGQEPQSSKACLGLEDLLPHWWRGLQILATRHPHMTAPIIEAGFSKAKWWERLGGWGEKCSEKWTHRRRATAFCNWVLGGMYHLLLITQTSLGTGWEGASRGVSSRRQESSGPSWMVAANINIVIHTERYLSPWWLGNSNFNSKNPFFTCKIGQNFRSLILSVTGHNVGKWICFALSWRYTLKGQFAVISDVMALLSGNPIPGDLPASKVRPQHWRGLLALIEREFTSDWTGAAKSSWIKQAQTQGGNAGCPRGGQHGGVPVGWSNSWSLSRSGILIGICGVFSE